MEIESKKRKDKNKMIVRVTAALIIILPFFIAMPAYAATLDQEWSKNVGTSELDQVGTMTKTSDGGYVVAGYSNADVDAGQGQNYMLAKLDAKGNQMWLIHLGGNVGFDCINQVIETSDGGLAIVGDTAGGMGDGGTIAAGGYVMKLDSSGNQVWGTNVGVRINDHFSTIIQTTDGGFAVAGSSNGDLGNGTIGSYDGAVIKLDSSGNKLWATNVGTVAQDGLNSMIQTDDGGFIAVGVTEGASDAYGFPLSDGLIVKVDAAGNRLWKKIAGTSQEDRINAVTKTADGGFVIAGITAGNMGNGYLGSEDGMVLKFDKDGNQIWGQNVGTSTPDIINSIIQTSDGGYALGGMTYGDLGNGNIGEYDGLMVKLDESGNQVWAKNVGTDQVDRISTIVETADGGFAVAGSTAGALSNGSMGGDDGFVIKFSPVYTISFNGNGGIGSMDNQSGFQDIGDSLAVNQFTNSGKTFGGWATSEENAKNGVVAYTDSQSISYTKDMSLYAIWESPSLPKFTVTFISTNAKGESTVFFIEVVDSGTCIVKPNVPQRDGYSFGGWYVDDNCTVLWDFTSDTMPDHDMTLYAKWMQTAQADTVANQNKMDRDKENTSLPQTGDTSESTMFWVMLIASLVGLSATFVTLDVRKKEEN